MKIMTYTQKFTPESLDFLKRMLEGGSTGQNTHWPPSIRTSLPLRVCVTASATLRVCVAAATCVCGCRCVCASLSLQLYVFVWLPLRVCVAV